MPKKSRGKSKACKNCGHGKMFHKRWGALDCNFPECRCKKYVPPNPESSPWAKTR